MANQSHIQILEEGVDIWNKWRTDNPGETPDLEGIDLSKKSLKKINFAGANLKKAKLRKTNLIEAKLVNVNLEGAELYGAKLERANLDRATLTKAELWNANLKDAKLGKACLKKALLMNADLRKARLNLADLRGANLHLANLERANLLRADLRETKCYGANMRFANLQYTNFTDAELTKTNFKYSDLTYSNFEKANVTDVRSNRWARFKGIQISTCYGSQRFRRHAQDQDFIEEFRGLQHKEANWSITQYHNHNFKFFIGPFAFLKEIYRSQRSWRFWLIYLPWLILADCGRSLLVWASWLFAFTILFAHIYYSLGKEAFNLGQKLVWNFDSMLYYSIVTFTTLGFGDVTPVSSSAKHWVMVEVIIGFIMLGGLISIFANKLARRSG